MNGAAGIEREVAVIGLGRTGLAAARWLTSRGMRVYASDSGTGESILDAAEELRELGVDAEAGGHDTGRIARADLAVVSPGVPPNADPVQAARTAGVEVIAELELAFRAMERTRFVVITGTNGKTTTTALIGAILRQAGISVEVAGNIGKPLIELAYDPPDWAVVEASSFQLHDCHQLSAAVGVLTCLSPDHLDRYDSVTDYFADKKRLFLNASESSWWVLNGDDPEVLALAAGVPGKRARFSLEDVADGWLDRKRGMLMLGDRELLPRVDLDLLGDHNVANALAAALAAGAVGAPLEATTRALSEFRSLPHRLEIVRDVDEVRFVNDSKATNVGATRVALAAMETPFILLLGGRHKGDPYAPLIESLEGCRLVVTFGEAAPLIERDLSAGVALASCDTLQHAVERAAAEARPGDTVLLSPACSSYDEFANYEVRGATFRKLVEGL